MARPGYDRADALEILLIKSKISKLNDRLNKMGYRIIADNNLLHIKKKSTKEKQIIHTIVV